MFGFDIEYLLDLDLASFDRLMLKAREARGAMLLEEAAVTRTAVWGDEKAWKSLTEAYTPDRLKEQHTKEKITKSVRQLHKLFGG